MTGIEEIIEKTKEYGVVIKVDYPVIEIQGLPGSTIQEEVIFENLERGYVTSLEKNSVKATLLSKGDVKVGLKVARLSKSISFPIGLHMLGQVVDPIGNPIFGTKPPKHDEMSFVDKKPKSISHRAKINKQLHTGLTLLDILIPIGMGQRELLTGDRKTGKTATIISIIKEQTGRGNKVVYAAIGKRSVEIKRVKELLEEMGCLSSTTIVATTSGDAPSLIDLTPYSAMTLAEDFVEKGENTIVIFDDLTTHAQSYREVSLMSRSFPGRESYPGDIFYKHARLLERAGNFKNKEGKIAALTAIPIAETLDSELSSYIISNLIGITDGHILLSKSLFNKGIRPAADIFLSVTRVGKQTQTPLLRSLNRSLTKFLADYNKSLEISHFGTEISVHSQNILKVGDQMYRFFSNNSASSIGIEVETVYLMAIWKGFLADYNIKSMPKFKKELKEYVYKTKEIQDIIKNVYDSKSLDEAVKLVEENQEILVKPWKG